MIPVYVDNKLVGHLPSLYTKYCTEAILFIPLQGEILVPENSEPNGELGCEIKFFHVRAHDNAVHTDSTYGLDRIDGFIPGDRQ